MSTRRFLLVTLPAIAVAAVLLAAAAAPEAPGLAVAGAVFAVAAMLAGEAWLGSLHLTAAIIAAAIFAGLAAQLLSR